MSLVKSQRVGNNTPHNVCVEVTLLLSTSNHVETTFLVDF